MKKLHTDRDEDRDTDDDVDSESAALTGRLDDYGCAVGDDLGQALADLARVEAEADDGVGAEQLRVLHHAVHCVPARILQQLGVLLHLTAASALKLAPMPFAKPMLRTTTPNVLPQ